MANFLNLVNGFPNPSKSSPEKHYCYLADAFNQCYGIIFSLMS